MADISIRLLVQGEDSLAALDQVSARLTSLGQAAQDSKISFDQEAQGLIELSAAADIGESKLADLDRIQSEIIYDDSGSHSTFYDSLAESADKATSASQRLAATGTVVASALTTASRTGASELGQVVRAAEQAQAALSAMSNLMLHLGGTYVVNITGGPSSDNPRNNTNGTGT